MLRDKVSTSMLVSHFCAIGDTISCDAPYSTIGFRAKFFLRCPPCYSCLWIAIGHLYAKKWGCSGYFGRVTKIALPSFTLSRHTSFPPSPCHSLALPGLTLSSPDPRPASPDPRPASPDAHPDSSQAIFLQHSEVSKRGWREWSWRLRSPQMQQKLFPGIVSTFS